ncbi:MAG TPA: HEAT repeat domain-containing protein [Pirellulales bacterium]|nr:HEAT repeat domain-containing protein [Pirellulales bacterium]
MATNQSTSIPLNKAHWALATLLVMVHVAALGVVSWGWIDGYRFAKPLLACAATSIVVNGLTLFTRPVPNLVLLNRIGLVAVLLVSATVGPLANLAGHDPRPWIWLITGVQAARALWIAPRGAPRLSSVKRLLLLTALSAWMYATPRMIKGEQQEQLFVNAFLAAAVVVVAARRAGWIGGLLLGAAAGILVVVVTADAWREYYGFTMGIDTIETTTVVAGVGALLGLAGRVERQMLGFGPAVELRRVDLDHKASAAARRLAQTLRWRGALVVTELPGGKKSGELDDAKAVPVLMEALSSKDLHVRYSAADVLGRIGSPAAPAIMALWRLVGSDPQPGDRPGEALARIGPDGVAALIELFHSDNPAQRIGAAQSLRLAGPHSAAAAEALAEALDDADAAVRQHAAASLGELGMATPTVIAALEKAHLDPALSVRYAARRSLARLGTAGTAP